MGATLQLRARGESPESGPQGPSDEPQRLWRAGGLGEGDMFWIDAAIEALDRSIDAEMEKAGKAP